MQGATILPTNRTSEHHLAEDLISKNSLLNTVSFHTKPHTQSALSWGFPNQLLEEVWMNIKCSSTQFFFSIFGLPRRHCNDPS